MSTDRSDNREPALITLLREQANKPDDSFGATVFCPAGAATVWRDLRVRPELLTEHPNGDRVYRVTTRQAVKALAVWEGFIQEIREAAVS